MNPIGRMILRQIESVDIICIYSQTVTQNRIKIVNCISSVARHLWERGRGVRPNNIEYLQRSQVSVLDIHPKSCIPRSHSRP
jgi:hypothetical protein